MFCIFSDIVARCFLVFQEDIDPPIEITLKKLSAYMMQHACLMMHNCSSWAGLNKLDICFCKYLKTLTGHRWPKNLNSNQALYKMCNTIPLSTRVAQLLCSIFGYILRMPEESLAQKSLEYAVKRFNHDRTQRDHHSTNLFDKLCCILRVYIYKYK